MPIFVQWKWDEQQLTFLVIFHFFDDYIKKNIRFRKKQFVGGDDKPAYLYWPIDHTFDRRGRRVQCKEVMTWAPSHPELALLTELLLQANIINGMKEERKRKLIKSLEEPVFAILDDHSESEGADEFADRRRFFLFGAEHSKPKDTFLCCAEVCPEYIDFIKDLVKQF